MSIKNFLLRLDQTICTYLGLKQEEVQPMQISFKEEQLKIRYTSSFKRHFVEQSWEDFSGTNMKQTGATNKKILGLALGQALAKNLIISFEPLNLKKDP